MLESDSHTRSQSAANLAIDPGKNDGIFLETAALRTKSRQEIRMSFWRQNVDQIISSNGFQVLTHAGTISHAQMESSTHALYLDFDQRRKQQDAVQADQQDEAELKALENTLKHRPKK